MRRYAITIADTIQLGEYSMSSGTEGISYATDSDGNRNIFNVEHDNDELWLNWNNGHPDNVWNPDNRFVFVLPRISHHFYPAHAG